MQLDNTGARMEVQEKKYSAFFYGTLLHPRVLKRVLDRSGEDLDIAPAILDGYIRHQVSWADFPAIIPASKSHDFFKPNSSGQDIDCVRGCYVSGLTETDIVKLDRFEAGLYDRKEVKVRLLLEPVNGLDSIDIRDLLEPMTDEAISGELQTRKALTYVWNQYLDELEADAWSFTDFVAQKLNIWG
ncbi:hypothetical protein FRC19_002467 [Serendipita sp. 401]|nr:hypothetical protein FRC19_002467 [Serendipita sp. 401]KAG9043878.1 hypothetical protein FS842_001641 [Serendipita sp. 407]